MSALRPFLGKSGSGKLNAAQAQQLEDARKILPKGRNFQ